MNNYFHPPSSHPSNHLPPTLPSIRNRTRRLITRTPRRRIHTRPNHRLARDILITRARNHAIHDPSAPGHMCRGARRRAHRYGCGFGPCAGPDGGPGDDVFGCAGGCGGFGFLGFGGAVDLFASVSALHSLPIDRGGKGRNGGGRRSWKGGYVRYAQRPDPHGYTRQGSSRPLAVQRCHRQ